MIRVTTDVFCDECGNWVHGQVGREKRVTRACQIAADQDWIVKRQNGQVVDICPECQKEEEPTR